MGIYVYQYNDISKYFEKKTGLHCEFTRDAKTMFLKVGDEMFKLPRKSSCDSEGYSKEQIIDLFEMYLDEKGIL
jgi:hypothetical protein